MPERNAPDQQDHATQSKVQELRAAIGAAADDPEALKDVVRAIGRAELRDVEAVRELLRLAEQHLDGCDVHDAFLEGSPWLQPMSEEEELAEGETLVIFGTYVANLDRKGS